MPMATYSPCLEVNTDACHVIPRSKTQPGWVGGKSSQTLSQQSAMTSNQLAIKSRVGA